MKTEIMTCDMCGREPIKNKDLVKARKDKKSPGPSLHWLGIDIRAYEYLYDDGGEHKTTHLDLCCDCKRKFRKFMEEEKMKIK